MPTIAFASTKGGAGKSTAAVLLAGELAAAGARVVLIDADLSRRPLVAWAALTNRPETIQVVASQGERAILDEIEQGRGQAPWVLVDCEGIASRLVSYVISQADLVVIPSREQQQDAQAAIDTAAEVARDGKATRRTIPVAVVLTQTSAVKDRTARHVAAELRSSGLPVLRTEIATRGAYSALWSLGGTLHTLDRSAVRSVEAAIANADAFAQELVGILRRYQQGKAPAPAGAQV
jgi:chromosome partitioning protein